MFGDVNILGTPPRGIKLQTRRGNDIANEAALAPEARHIRSFQDLLTVFNRWEVRCDPIGIYNCAGHVWASRRTSIYDDFAYRLIIDDDGYREISEANVRPGDITIYLDEEDREIYHVGLVVEMRELVVGGSTRVPWVLSKLGDSMGEVLHSAYDFRLPNYSLRPRFWTERVN
jgi:hypothetical protein